MLPERPGSYVLILHLMHSKRIGVGRLGEFDFDAGWYAYVGSARGPGGLAARIARHQREPKPRHWHIDYLRAHAELIAVWYTVGSLGRECSWAGVLRHRPQASLPIPGFGASDCRCPGHLIYFGARPRMFAFAPHAGTTVADVLLSAS